MSSGTTTSRAPDESILTALQELLDSWSDEDYSTCSQKCIFLLKKKRAVHSSLTTSIQRLLLQSWLQQDKYKEVIEWIETNNNNNNNSASSSSSAVGNHHKDLGLYAYYRLEEYDRVSQQASKDTKLEQHLLAQSSFHLKRNTTSLKVYFELLKEINDKNTTTNTNNDDDNDTAEEKMEALTNALAIITSDITPFIPLTGQQQHQQQNNNTNTTNLTLIQQANEFLNTHPEYSDLSFNLGTMQYLTDPTTMVGVDGTTNWLENAEVECDEDDEDDLIPIQINMVWSNHFWYNEMDEVNYNDTNITNTAKANSNQIAIMKVNQSILDENLSKFPSQPHTKWNTLQLRMYWYNRAVLQYKMGKYVECQESCQSLKKILGIGNNESSSKSNSKNKKKNKNNDSNSTSSKSNKSPGIIWWETQTDIILTLAQYQQQQQQQQNSSNKKSSTEQAKTKFEQRLEMLQSYQSTTNDNPTIDHAMAHVQLQLHALQYPSPTKEQKRKVLKSLPASIQSRPAVIATLEALGDDDDDDDDDDELVNSSKNKRKSKSTPVEQADLLFKQGKYQQAAEMYKNVLPEPADSSDSDHIHRHLKRVQALTMCGRHDEATEVWELVQDHLDSFDTTSAATTLLSSLDGETLEEQGLPRGSTVKMDKRFALNDTQQGTASSSKSKRSHDSIMRRRARKREEYLKELEAKGAYNPNRPIKPNPERWIPKQDRSSKNRGGGGGGGRRRQNNNNSTAYRSAQGGGSQADAQRLDAAARREGRIPTNTGPSTANMKVSATGGSRKGGRRR